MTNRKYYIVRTRSTFHMAYAISSNEDLRERTAELESRINQFGPSELTQVHSGEEVTDVEGPYTEEEYIAKHDELFPDLKEELANYDKLMVINYEKLSDEGIMLDDEELL